MLTNQACNTRVLSWTCFRLILWYVRPKQPTSFPHYCHVVPCSQCSCSWPRCHFYYDHSSSSYVPTKWTPFAIGAPVKSTSVEHVKTLPFGNLPSPTASLPTCHEVWWLTKTRYWSTATVAPPPVAVITGGHPASLLLSSNAASAFIMSRTTDPPASIGLEEALFFQTFLWCRKGQTLAVAVDSLIIRGRRMAVTGSAIRVAVAVNQCRYSPLLPPLPSIMSTILG